MAKVPGALPADPVPYMRLTALVADLADGGELLPCVGSDWPTSEDAEEREFVRVNWCPQCPAVDACRKAGEQERWGIWGGVERARKPAAARERRKA